LQNPFQISVKEADRNINRSNLSLKDLASEDFWLALLEGYSFRGLGRLKVLSFIRYIFRVQWTKNVDFIAVFIFRGSKPQQK